MRLIQDIVYDIAQASKINNGRVLTALTVMMRDTGYVWIDQQDLPEELKAYSHYAESKEDDHNLQQAWNKATAFKLCLEGRNSEVFTKIRQNLLNSVINTAEIFPLLSALERVGIGAVPKHMVSEKSVLSFVETFHANDDFINRRLMADYIVEARKALRSACGSVINSKPA